MTSSSKTTAVSGARQKQREATRRGILDAAVTSFARLGFDGTNFREITALCGAQRPLILYHFQTKEQLWQQAVQEVERRFNRAFEDRYQADAATDDRSKVRAAMSCFIDTLCAVPEYGQIMLREGSGSGPRMEWLARHFVPRRALTLELDDRTVLERMQKTVLRDILASTLVTFVTLGPLMERSLAGVTGQTSAGVHPLTEARKQELLEYMLKLIFDD